VQGTNSEKPPNVKQNENQCPLMDSLLTTKSLHPTAIGYSIANRAESINCVGKDDAAIRRYNRRPDLRLRSNTGVKGLDNGLKGARIAQSSIPHVLASGRSTKAAYGGKAASGKGRFSTGRTKRKKQR